jgi:histidyl-tRNA synthetase
MYMGPSITKPGFKSQILESEILVLCESMLQELSTRAFHIRYNNTIILTEVWPFENVQNRDNQNFTKSRKFAS